MVRLRDCALGSGQGWIDAPLEPYTSTACVVRGNVVLGEASEEARVLGTEEVNQLVRCYAHLAEHIHAQEEWWGGAVALDHFIDGVCQFVRSAHDGTVTAEHKWRGWVVNTQTSTQPGSHWFTVCLAVALPRPGMKRASMEGTAGTEPQKQRRVTEPSASRQGQEEPHEADGAGVAGEAKDDLASPQPAAEAQGEGAPRSGSLSKRSASSARAAALDLEEPARKDARRARAAGPAAAASRPKASSSSGEAEGKPNREPDGAESRHRADVLAAVAYLEEPPPAGGAQRLLQLVEDWDAALGAAGKVRKPLRSLAGRMGLSLPHKQDKTAAAVSQCIADAIVARTASLRVFGGAAASGGAAEPSAQKRRRRAQKPREEGSILLYAAPEGAKEPETEARVPVPLTDIENIKEAALWMRGRPDVPRTLRENICNAASGARSRR